MRVLQVTPQTTLSTLPPVLLDLGGFKPRACSRIGSAWRLRAGSAAPLLRALGSREAPSCSAHTADLPGGVPRAAAPTQRTYQAGCCRTSLPSKEKMRAPAFSWPSEPENKASQLGDSTSSCGGKRGHPASGHLVPEGRAAQGSQQRPRPPKGGLAPGLPPSPRNAGHPPPALDPGPE